jgi:hypothetical protein
MDRDGPQFAKTQRLAGLIDTDESSQLVSIEVAVGVGDVGPHDPEDPGMTLKEAGAQLGKQPEVARWQVPPDLPDLLLDSMEVVHQPLGGRHYRTLGPDIGNRDVIAAQQACTVLFHPSQQGGHRLGPLHHDLTVRQAQRMPEQLVVAEQFRANDRGIAARRIARTSD